MGEGDLIQDRKIRGKITIPGRVPVEFENARCHVGELRAAEPAKLGEWTPELCFSELTPSRASEGRLIQHRKGHLDSHASVDQLRGHLDGKNSISHSHAQS